MRFERFGRPGGPVSEGGWSVFAEPEDRILMRPDQPFTSRLGFISYRGALRPSSYSGQARDWKQRATYYLEDARTELERRGDVVSPRRLTAVRRERREGSFVLELDSGQRGQEVRFNTIRSENPRERGNELYRPGAADFAEEALAEGRAAHADLFRAPVARTERTPIYRGGYLGHGSIEFLPFQSWSRTSRGDVVRNSPPPLVFRGYDLKRRAMLLVDDHVYDGPIDPAEIAAAWDVTMDAFIEAGLPLQEAFARDNADYWLRRAGVSSRRPAGHMRRRR